MTWPIELLSDYDGRKKSLNRKIKKKCGKKVEE